MTDRVSALIPAAGSGERLGMGPKAFVRVGSKTLLERAITAFSGLVDEVIVALPESHLDAELPAGVQRVLGGLSRQQSVLNLLEAARSDLVLIHDAARPFLPHHVIQAMLEAVQNVGAATVALPAADTLVLENPLREWVQPVPIGDTVQNADSSRNTVWDGAFWGDLLDRSRMHAIQTPQGFRRALILEAHAKAVQEGIIATDDAGLVARLGLPVALVPGDPRLFKVTRAGDYALAEAFARVWDEENARGEA